MSRKGFTLIEVLVVIVLVAVLAAIAIPIYRGRIEQAKWSEGKAIAGVIANSLRAYAAEKGEAGTYGENLPSETELGFALGELKGTYFNTSNFSWTSNYKSDGALAFSVDVSKGPGMNAPEKWSLNENGIWSEQN